MSKSTHSGDIMNIDTSKLTMLTHNSIALFHSFTFVIIHICMHHIKHIGTH